MASGVDDVASTTWRGPAPSSAAVGPDRLEIHVQRLAADPRAVGVLHLPQRRGVTGDWPAWLDPEVRQAYENAGIDRPWRHQCRVADHAWQHEHVVIATGTASGKSAAFGMPGLTAALSPTTTSQPRGSSVLYLSPTKALAHDQLAGLRSLGLNGLRAAAVDGDTSDEERSWARSHARWVVTNPDMLHRSLLPRHTAWRGFLRSLRYVVVDEAHSYRGVFGSHVALVLRRLRRVAALYGATPTFIAASATVADPGSTASRLLGVDVAVVDTDDSRRGAVDVILWNPNRSTDMSGSTPDVGTSFNSDGGRATLTDATELMASLVDSDVSTLTFARSRRAVEIVAARVRDIAVAGQRVRAYRGGYLPEERRALEAQLRSRHLLGLATTNALELGINITGLDAVILVGWPGTRASFWQQIGRAGRQQGSALAVLVARQDPLDQYVVANPESLTGRPVEACVLDPTNPYVLAGHLCAAAAEVALSHEELTSLFGPGAEALCKVLGERGLLRRRRAGWHWTDPARAVDLVDLRGGGGGLVRVVETGTGRLLGTVDMAGAQSAVHEGAVYVHQGATFEVQGLDIEARVAHATATLTDLSTHARSSADVTFQTVRNTRRWGRARVSRGDVVVTRQVHSYLVRRWPSGQVVTSRPLDLPPVSLQTVAMWWSIPDTLLRTAGIDEAEVAGAIHALEHAAIGILPVLVTCDRWDLGGVSSPRHPQEGSAVIVVHDGQPGGAGFSERGYDHIAQWLSATRQAIGRCPCSGGCPACVQSPKCGNGNEPLNKAAALKLADALLREQEPGPGSGSSPDRAKAWPLDTHQPGTPG